MYVIANVQILCLCHSQPKCDRYWNDELNTPLELSDNLTVTTTDLKSYNEYEIRTLSIKNVC